MIGLYGVTKKYFNSSVKNTKIHNIVDRISFLPISTGFGWLIYGIIHGIMIYSIMHIYNPIFFWISIAFTIYVFFIVLIKAKIRTYKIIKCFLSVVVLLLIILYGAPRVDYKYFSYVSLQDIGIDLPIDVNKIQIYKNTQPAEHFSYTDTEKIQCLIKYLQSLRLSSNVISEEDYYKPVTPPERLGGGNPAEYRWVIVFLTENGNIFIYLCHNRIGYVYVDPSERNPIIKFWELSQEQDKEFETLLRSLIPDQLPRYGGGFVEWLEGLDPSEAIGLTMDISDATPTGCSLDFTLSNGLVIYPRDPQTGIFLELEQLDDSGNWRKLKLKTGSEWGENTYFLKNYGSTKLNVDWSDMYGELSEGHYRIHKIVTANVDGQEKEFDLYAEFDLPGT